MHVQLMWMRVAAGMGEEKWTRGALSSKATADGILDEPEQAIPKALLLQTGESWHLAELKVVAAWLLQQWLRAHWTRYP